MAKIIKADGTVETIDKELTLEVMQKVVGGYIQIVTAPNGQLIVLDEEGKIKGKSVNVRATNLYGNPHDLIVGDVIVANNDEID